MTQERFFDCDEEGCRYRTPNEAVAEVHNVGHLIRQAVARVDTAAKQMTAPEGVAAQLAALPEQIQEAMRGLAAAMQPRHASAEEVLAEAGGCPNCQGILDGFTAHAAQQAPAKAPEPAPAPVAPEPRPWRIPDDDVDYLALDAYGLVAEQGDNGEAVLRVRDASLWDEALAAQVVPAGCVLKVGADGKTQYVCEVPRG